MFFFNVYSLLETYLKIHFITGWVHVSKGNKHILIYIYVYVFQ